MASPANLKYTKDHEWARLEGDVATVGITDYAQHSLGDVVYVDMGSKGKAVKQHETFGVVESVKAASDLFSPVSGAVSQINTKLVDNPELVNKDPYGDGCHSTARPTGRTCARSAPFSASGPAGSSK